MQTVTTPSPPSKGALFHLYAGGTYVRSAHFASQAEADAAAKGAVQRDLCVPFASGAISDAELRSRPRMSSITDSRGRVAPF